MNDYMSRSAIPAVVSSLGISILCGFFIITVVFVEMASGLPLVELPETMLALLSFILPFSLLFSLGFAFFIVSPYCWIVGSFVLWISDRYDHAQNIAIWLGSGGIAGVFFMSAAQNFFTESWALTLPIIGIPIGMLAGGMFYHYSDVREPKQTK